MDNADPTGSDIGKRIGLEEGTREKHGFDLEYLNYLRGSVKRQLDIPIWNTEDMPGLDILTCQSL